MDRLFAEPSTYPPNLLAKQAARPTKPLQEVRLGYSDRTKIPASSPSNWKSTSQADSTCGSALLSVRRGNCRISMAAWRSVGRDGGPRLIRRPGPAHAASMNGPHQESPSRAKVLASK